MAKTFTEVTLQGFDAWAAMAHGSMITSFDYSYQEAPEVYQDIIYAYRDPLIAQFLIEASVRKGSTSSDQNRWYEAGRIQNSYDRSVLMTTIGTAGAASVLTFPVGKEFDIRTGDTIMVGALATDITGTADILEQFRVTSVDTAAKTASVLSYEGTASTLVAANLAVDEVLTVTHLATDNKQGSTSSDESITREGTWRSNNPIILDDYQKYDRSKLKQITQFSDDLTRYMIDTKGMDARFDIQQVLAGVFGIAAKTGTLKTSGIDGTESVISSVQTRGNTATGTWAAKSDLDNYVKLLDSVKGSKTNMLLLELDSALNLDAALASVAPHGDANTYDYGVFGEDVDYRRLGFSGVNIKGWETIYKAWDILSDTTYYGAHAGNANRITGLSIPKGSVELASGGSRNYLDFLYRDGQDKTVGKDGAVVGLGHYDGLSVSYHCEFTPITVSAKDFIAFSEG